MFYPYSDSPELRRVAKAQEVLSDVSTHNIHLNRLCSEMYSCYMPEYLMVNIYNVTSRDDSHVISVPLENAVNLFFFFPPMLHFYYNTLR